MKANINKKPDFGKEFVESAIVLNRTMDDICKELKTTSYYVEKRIFVLYDEFEAGAKIDALYGDDSYKTHEQKQRLTPTDKEKIPEIAALLQSERPVDIIRSVSGSILDDPFYEDEVDDDLIPDFIDFLSQHIAEGVEYALGQLEADEAVGERFEAADTTASKADIKRLDAEINAMAKKVSDAQNKLNEKAVAKTAADERVERTTEKLRRAKNDAARAAFDLESAKDNLRDYTDELETMRKKRDEMQRDIDNRELPSFYLVPSGDYVVLKGVNYDTRCFNLDAALKWSRRIGEKFSGLSDSEFSVMGRLFGILSEMRGKDRFKIEIDPSLDKIQEIWDEFGPYFLG